MRGSTWWLRVPALPIWTGAVLLCVVQYRAAWQGKHPGYDLQPLYLAGQAAAQGRSVYDAPMFVYPPTAGVMALPLTHWPLEAVLTAGLAVTAALILALGALTVYAVVPASPLRPALAGALAAALIGGSIGRGEVYLGNASLLVALGAVGVVWLAGRGRWWAACGLLVVTLLLKPLLVPLVLIPFLARRWLPALAWLAAGAVALVASLPLAGGLSQAGEVVALLTRGSILTGRFAVYNLSLHALGEAHHLPSPAVDAARALVLAAVVLALVVVVRRQRVWDAPAVAWLAMLLLLAVFLAGSLSEGHYLFTLVPGAVSVVACSTSLVARLLAVAGLALLALPPLGLDNLQSQALYVGIEVLLFAAAFLATVRGAVQREETASDRGRVAAPEAATAGERISS